MGIFHEISKAFYRSSRPQKAPKPQKPSKPQELLPFTPMASWNLPEPPEKDSKAQIEAYQSWVYACATIRAQKLATISLFLNKKQPNGEMQEIEKHEVLDLLYSVNQFCTFYDLIELTSLYLDLAGEAFWWLLRDSSGKIVQIYPYLAPNQMDIATSSTEFIKGYVYNVPGTTQKIPFEIKDIIHFKYANPLNPYRGLSPVKAADLAISSDREASIYNWRFFKNSAVPAGVLMTEKILDDNTYQRIKAQWDSAHKGTNNAFRVAILEAGTKYENMGLGQKELEFLEGRKLNRDEILSMFRVPKSMIGLTEDVNRANAEATIAMFQEHVIMPNMRKLVSYLNEFLLKPNYEEGLFFDFDNPTQGNQEMELAYYQNGLANGWLSPNEIRQWEGLDPIDGGDSVYLPFSLQSYGIAPQKKKRDYLMKYRARTTQEKMYDLIRPAVQKKLKQISPVKKKNEERKILWAYPEKMLIAFHKAKIQKTDAEEKLMRGKLKKEFQRQEEEILRQLNQKSLSDIDFNAEEEQELFVKIFNPIFEEFYKTHGEDALKIIGLEGFEISPKVRQTIKTQVANFADDINKTTADKIKTQLQEGLDEGESIPEMGERIREIFKSATVNRSQIIARTEVSKAVGESSQEAWEQSGVVEKKQWFTALDERVCEICEPLHGEIAALDGTFSGDDLFGDVEAEPAHISCRCSTVPIVESK